jgi:PhzF family phenazine biosynthesis protein
VLDARGLDDHDMLSIAGALGYSETAFVLPDELAPDRPRIRYFSPRAEVAFCGHATIATAVAIADRDGPGRLGLTTLGGLVTVTTEATGHGTAATMVSPPTHTRPASHEAVRRTLEAFGWRATDLDPAYPVHVANAGNDHLVIAAASRERLASLSYDYAALDRLTGEEGWTTVHVFWAETPALFHARNPFPAGGVVEDPATGAAAAAFGGYLRSLGLVQGPGRITIRQGHYIGRPSRLVVDLPEGDDGVSVTGHATRLPEAPLHWEP